jgi:hypothetical protein
MKEYIVYEADAYNVTITEDAYWTNPDGTGLFKLINGAMSQQRGNGQFSAKDKTELIRNLNKELGNRFFKTRAGANLWLAKRGQS